MGLIRTQNYNGRHWKMKNQKILATNLTPKEFTTDELKKKSYNKKKMDSRNKIRQIKKPT